jgi:hypothetical protein
MTYRSTSLEELMRELELFNAKTLHNPRRLRRAASKFDISAKWLGTIGCFEADSPGKKEKAESAQCSIPKPNIKN